MTLFADRGRRSVALLLFPVILAYFLAPSARAQETQTTSVPASDTQPATTQSRQPPAGQITIDELQLQLKQAQDATDIAEDVKAKLVNAYTQAIQQLQLAQQWAAKAAESEAARLNTPETLKAIQAELATPLEEPKPDVPPEATRADLEQRLKQVKTDLDAEKQAQADWEQERDRRTTRRKEIPASLTDAKTRLQALAEAPETPAEAEQPAAVRVAQQALLQTRKLAIEREIQAYEGELLSYDARGDLLQVRLDRAARRVAHFEKLVSAWQDLVQERGRIESERAIREAREQLKRAHPAIRPLAEERESLALKSNELQAASKQATDRITEIDAQLAKLREDFDKIKKRVSATGLTNAIGQLLRKHRAELPSLRPLERSLRQGKDKIGAVDLRMMELEERRKELRNIDPLVGQILESLDRVTPEDERRAVREAAEETLSSLKASVDNLHKDCRSYFDKLVDLDDKERALIKEVKRLSSYIDEKVLWIQSGSTLGLSDVHKSREAVAWLIDANGWRSAVVSVWGTARAKPVAAPLGLLGLLVLVILRPRLRAALIQAGDLVSKPTKDAMVHTFKALLYTGLLAAMWPAVLWFIAWAAASPSDSSDFSKAIAAGLKAAAIVLLTVEFVRQLSRRNGLAKKHFRWRAAPLRLTRRHLFWLVLILLPTFFLFSTLDWQTTEAWKESLGRVAFIIAFIGVAVFAQRVLRPVGGVLSDVLRDNPSGWLYRLRHVWYPLGVAVPAALVIAAALGYYYTALYLGWRLIATVWVFLGLLVLHASTQRWLLLQVRRRALRDARERAVQKRQQQEGMPQIDGEDVPLKVEEPKVDVSDINQQTSRLVRTAVVVAGLAGIWMIWAPALPALGVLRDITLWKNTVQMSETVKLPDGRTEINEFTREVPITLADLGLALVILFVTIVAVKNIPGLLEITILQKLPIDTGGRFAVTAITRYILTVVGIVVAFGTIGIGWSKVQWLVAAVSLGLGFGLQEIFANFVSGLMLLFERPIRIGDTVTVGDINGTVTRIRIRATTITDWDRKELVIPNKQFITGQVINWTLSDSVLRIIIPVGIAYGSDTELAEQLLRKVASETEHVLADPKPKVFFMGFGDSSLNFELRLFVPSVDYLLSVRHQLHKAIDQEFRRAGIEIAFPQRDIHVRSMRDSLPILEDKGRAPAAEQE